MEAVVRRTGMEMTYVEVPDADFKSALPMVARQPGRAVRLGQHRRPVVRVRGGAQRPG